MSGDLAILWRLLHLFRPYWRWMGLGAALACATILANVGLMAIAGGFIASMAIAGLAGQLMNYFLPAAGIRLMAMLRTGGRYLERLVSHEATFRLLARLRIWLYWRMEPLAPSALENHRGADLVSRLQADIDTLQHAYLRLFAPVAVALVCALAITALLAMFSVGAALVVLALLAVAGVIVPLATRRTGADDGAMIVSERAALRVALVDTLQGMSDLRSSGAADARIAELIASSDRLRAHQRRSAGWGALAEGAVGSCAQLAMWGVALIAIAGVASGALSRADVPMLALAALASFEAVAPLPLAAQRMAEVVAAARRIFALADTPPPIPVPVTPVPLPATPGITMRGVSLRYGGTSAPALADFDLTLPPGHRIAILGASGAGKSSIARLLLRLHEYQCGDVHIGGVDLRACDPVDLRRRIAAVTQDTRLFNAAIAQNLRLAAPDADAAAMERAMRVAQLHDFVASLPEGYDTWIGEAGARLSTGQARRLAVARALLRDAPILLLDEPAEGLDAETGRALLAALVAHQPDAAMLVITHAPEDVAGLVDEILWLEAGRITRHETCRRSA